MKSRAITDSRGNPIHVGDIVTYNYEMVVYGTQQRYIVITDTWWFMNTKPVCDGFDPIDNDIKPYYASEVTLVTPEKESL